MKLRSLKIMKPVTLKPNDGQTSLYVVNPRDLEGSMLDLWLSKEDFNTYFAVNWFHHHQSLIITITFVKLSTDLTYHNHQHQHHFHLCNYFFYATITCNLPCSHSPNSFCCWPRSRGNADSSPPVVIHTQWSNI